MNNKIIIVAGTRPEIIKLAPVYHALNARGFESLMVLTAQQDELTRGLTEWFEVRNLFRCNILSGNTLVEKLGEITRNLEAVILRIKPVGVVVQGDTTSALAGAISSFYNHVAVIHVEAGLRCESVSLPFPEEANRRLISKISHLNFAPTTQAQSNLISEGVDFKQIKVTGNTVVDALKFTLQKLDLLNKSKLVNSNLNVLVTVHRRESFGEPLLQICQAINEISENSNIKITWPIHTNPEVSNVISANILIKDNVNLVSPLSYPEMVKKLTEVDLILTDSGGIQEEALALGLPVLILRGETERPELIESGLGKLVGSNRIEIVREFKDAIQNLGFRETIQLNESVLGIGLASQLIAESIQHQLLENFKVAP